MFLLRKEGEFAVFVFWHAGISESVFAWLHCITKHRTVLSSLLGCKILVNWWTASSVVFLPNESGVLGILSPCTVWLQYISQLIDVLSSPWFLLYMFSQDLLVLVVTLNAVQSWDD